MFTNAGVKSGTIARLGEAGVTTTGLFCNIASTPEAMRTFLTQGVGMNDTDYRGDFLEIANILSALEDARLFRATVGKKTAEQKAEAPVPSIQLEVYEEARDVFNEAEYELEDSQAPSKAHLERKIDEAGQPLGLSP